MRLKSAIWVSAYLRRCGVEGAFAVVRRHGADEAGAVFIMVNRLDGTAKLYGPAPQALFDAAQPSERMFTPLVGGKEAVAEAAAEARIAREIKFDPDLWVIEVEDRAGRHFLDRVVT